MKATLTFDLPEEQDLFDTASHASDWRGVVEDMDEQLRKWIKYGNEFAAVDAAIEAARAKLHECIGDHGLRLFD
jgi:hypothetical protein